MKRNITFFLAMITMSALAWPASPTSSPQNKKDPKSLRIAVVQQNGNPGKPEENRAKALKSAAQAIEHGADVVLFHEELLLGYIEDPHKLAEPLDGPTTRAFQKLLRGKDALIIYGLTEKDGDKYYISAPIVSAKGVVANYRKTHLWSYVKGVRNEADYYQRGDRLVTFDVKGHRCGIMICFDGDFPEMTRSYANLRCSVLFWMNNRPSCGHERVKDLAFRNSMIIAAACCCGPCETGFPCRGGSNITGANGGLISEIWDKEGIIFADVQPDQALALRAKSPYFQGRHPELYVNEEIKDK